MADKSPRKPDAKPAGHSKRSEQPRSTSTTTAPACPKRWPSVIADTTMNCWYGDPEHRPTIGWCPPSCNGPPTHSERSGNGDQLVYCEAHAYWRRKTIGLPLVRRLQTGKQPEPLRPGYPEVSQDHAPREVGVA